MTESGGGSKVRGGAQGAGRGADGAAATAPRSPPLLVAAGTHTSRAASSDMLLASYLAQGGSRPRIEALGRVCLNLDPKILPQLPAPVLLYSLCF